jgi:hypothetical protein
MLERESSSLKVLQLLCRYQVATELLEQRRLRRWKGEVVRTGHTKWNQLHNIQQYAIICDPGVPHIRAQLSMITLPHAKCRAAPPNWFTLRSASGQAAPVPWPYHMPRVSRLPSLSIYVDVSNRPVDCYIEASASAHSRLCFLSLFENVKGLFIFNPASRHTGFNPMIDL